MAVELWQVIFIGTVVAGLALAGWAFGFGAETDPVPWRRAFRDSPIACLPPVAVWPVRLVVLAFSFYFWVKNLQSRAEFYGPDPAWLFYLTCWNANINLVAYGLLVFLARPNGAVDQVYQLLPGPGADTWAEPEQPFLFKVLLVLLSVAFPLSLIVAALFWLFDHPVWQLCVFKQTQPCETLDISATSYWLHLFGPLANVLVFLLGLIPFYFKNAGWYQLVALAYGIWTYLNHAFGIGTPGFTCGEGTTPAECPLYPVLDWRNPQTAAIIVAVAVLLAGPAMAVIYRLLGAAREFAVTRSCKGA